MFIVYSNYGNANHNNFEISFIPVGMARINKAIFIHAECMDEGKREYSFSVGGIVNCWSHCGNINGTLKKYIIITKLNHYLIYDQRTECLSTQFENAK